MRAWSIYEQRGGGNGRAMDDWLEATRQLFAERGLEGKTHRSIAGSEDPASIL